MSCTKEHEMVELEIEACKNNIKFYELQINEMEQKIKELEKLKEHYKSYY